PQCPGVGAVVARDRKTGPSPAARRVVGLLGVSGHHDPYRGTDNDDVACTVATAVAATHATGSGAARTALGFRNRAPAPLRLNHDERPDASWRSEQDTR